MVAAVSPHNVPPMFAQRASWRAFEDPSTEALYRTWRLDQIVPVARAIGFGGVFLWSLVPLAYQVIVGGDPHYLRISNWLIAVPIFVAVIISSYTPLRGRATWTISIAIILIGLDFVWVMSRMFTTHGGPVTAGVLAVIFFPLIVRLPTVATTVIVAILTAVPVALLVIDTKRGAVSLSDSWAYIAILLLGVPVLVVAAASIEAGMRQQFAATKQLELTQRLIRRYVPSAVASRIEAGNAVAVDAPQRLRVTALSSDVAGFTVMADRLDPESLSQIISEYVGAMSDIVEGHGGVVTEFAGDGLMAIFGAPEQSDPVDQVRKALATAGAMHARLAELNASWYQLGIEHPLKVRIGINTGVLSVGTFGSDGRGTYTAIGLQMNIAARVQAHCEPGTTLLSSSSWHLVKEETPCKPLGEITVKGVHFPISIYSVGSGS